MARWWLIFAANNREEDTSAEVLPSSNCPVNMLWHRLDWWLMGPLWEVAPWKVVLVMNSNVPPDLCLSSSEASLMVLTQRCSKPFPSHWPWSAPDHRNESKLGQATNKLTMKSLSISRKPLKLAGNDGGRGRRMISVTSKPVYKVSFRTSRTVTQSNCLENPGRKKLCF